VSSAVHTKRKIVKLLIKVKKLKVPPPNATDEEHEDFLEKDLVDPLLELSKCNDLSSTEDTISDDYLNKTENEPG
jgi:hypothetical protein